MGRLRCDIMGVFRSEPNITHKRDPRLLLSPHGVSQPQLTKIGGSNCAYSQGLIAVQAPTVLVSEVFLHHLCDSRKELFLEVIGTVRSVTKSLFEQSFPTHFLFRANVHKLLEQVWKVMVLTRP